MDLKTIEEMMIQYEELELKLVSYINKENVQFVETEEMKILRAYADTSRILISHMHNEITNPYKLDVRNLNSKVIVEHHYCPIALLESLKYSLNIRNGISKDRALHGLLKNINKYNYA